MSAKRLHESGWEDPSALFAPFQRVPTRPGASAGSTLASASIKGAGAVHHRPLHSSDSGSCSAPPSFSPERKPSSTPASVTGGARSRSSRFCCSFRRTLRRTPKHERLVNEVDSTASSGGGAERTGGAAGETDNNSEGMKGSVGSLLHHNPSAEESQALVRAWMRKESRAFILPDSKPNQRNRDRSGSGAGSLAASEEEAAARHRRESSTFSRKSSGT